MSIFDTIKQAFEQGGNQVAASKAGAAQGLPPLQGAFEDYGPWGAGGSPTPFARAIMQGNSAQQFPQSPAETGPLQPQAPAAPPAKFNAMLDPERGGLLSTIGALTGAPTRAEWERQQAGAGANAAYGALAERMKTMSPQAAILDYVHTPEGQQWFMHAADPIGDIKQIVGQLVPPQSVTAVKGALVRDADGTVVYQAPEDPYNLSPGQTHVTPGSGQTVTAPLSPTEMKQKYNDYVADEQAHGRTPKGLDEWQTSHERAVAAQQSAVTKSGKVIAPDWVKKQVELTDGVSSAQSTVQLLTQFDNILGSTDTGAAQAMEQPIRSLFVSMGLASEDTAKQVGAMGMLEGMGNQLALLARTGGFTSSDKIGLTGNTSDRDLTFLIKSVPNIWNTTLANKGLIVVLRAQARRKATVDYLKAEYISGEAPGQTTDGGNLNGFQEYLDKQLQPGGSLDGNFFTPDEQKFLLDLNSKSAGAPPRAPLTKQDAATADTASPLTPGSKWGAVPKDEFTDLPEGQRQRAWEYYNEEMAKGKKK
jgi:hypothetical protein